MLHEPKTALPLSPKATNILLPLGLCLSPSPRSQGHRCISQAGAGNFHVFNATAKRRITGRYWLHRELAPAHIRSPSPSSRSPRSNPSPSRSSIPSSRPSSRSRSSSPSPSSDAPSARPGAGPGGGGSAPSAHAKEPHRRPIRGRRARSAAPHWRAAHGAMAPDGAWGRAALAGPLPRRLCG